MLNGKLLMEYNIHSSLYAYMSLLVMTSQMGAYQLRVCNYEEDAIHVTNKNINRAKGRLVCHSLAFDELNGYQRWHQGMIHTSSLQNFLSCPNSRRMC